MDQESWIKDWFNEDYVRLYAQRSLAEAKQQIDFIIKQLDLKKNEKILDVGCGFGRHVKLLDSRGYHAMGIDTSSVLIKKAQEGAKEKKIFILGDIREAQTLGKFDVILSLFTSFGYSDDRGNKLILDAIHSHLVEEGHFFLDYLNPDYVQNHLVPFEEKKVGSEIVIIKRAIANGYIQKTIHFPAKTYEERVRLYDHHALLQLIEESGFNIIDTFGNFEGEAWTKNSERQIVIASLS